MSSMLGLRREAEASGCLVEELVIRTTPFHPWAGAAGWLARIWDASGRPTVLKADWETAFEQSLRSLQVYKLSEPTIVQI